MVGMSVRTWASPYLETTTRLPVAKNGSAGIDI